MRMLALRYFFAWTAALAAMLMSAPLWASGTAATAPRAAACELPPARQDTDLLANREEELSRYEALPQQCLKALLIECGKAADEQLLDLGSAATCSIGYEALLKRGFGGNFQAMVAWWQNRDGARIN